MDATSGAAAVWWWIGIVALFVVVIPVVLYLAQRVLVRAIEVKRYADDILDHGVQVTRNLEPVSALQETRDLVKQVGAGLTGYVQSVDKLLAKRS